MPDEVATDLQEIGKPVVELFKAFHEETGREIKLEVEPGTLLLGARMFSCDLGTRYHFDRFDGYRFLKLDGGMTEILRPSLYGAQHPIMTTEAGQENFANPPSKRSVIAVNLGICLLPHPDPRPWAQNASSSRSE